MCKRDIEKEIHVINPLISSTSSKIGGFWQLSWSWLSLSGSGSGPGSENGDMNWSPDEAKIGLFLDLEDPPPPAIDSLDFFRRFFLGTSAEILAGESLESMDRRPCLGLSVASLTLAFFEDRRCLAFSDFADRVGESLALTSPPLIAKCCRLDAFGNSGTRVLLRFPSPAV